MIRRAEEKDLGRIEDLLSQVLEIHAGIRPDLFIPGTRKYTEAELKELIRDDSRPIWVWTDEDDTVMGYAFCIIHEPQISPNMIPHRMLYIDDLCVDENCRGRHVGQQLFEYVKKEARNMGCHHLTLNVWEGNDSARSFYDHQGLQIQKTVMEMILDEE